MCFKKGKVIIISAPSGSGKTTITRFLLTQNLNLHFSVSVCSREKRSNEVDGVDYHFIGLKEFKKRLKNNELLEWEEVYKDSFYGTLREDVISKLDSGKNIIFDIDVKGALSLKRFFKHQCFTIYIDVPKQVIERRLRNRKTESEKDIVSRLLKVKKEKMFMPQFDNVVVNIDLDESKKEVLFSVKEFLKK